MTALLPHDLTIKAAVREVLDRLGGATGAASHCRLHHSQLSNCGSNSSSQMLPLDVAWRLERAADHYAITSALASVADKVLTPRIAAPGVSTPRDVLALTAHATAEAGDALRAAAEGAADGSFCAADLANLEQQAHEAADAWLKVVEWVSTEKLRRQQGGTA